jgi:hypothetical protein
MGTPVNIMSWTEVWMTIHGIGFGSAFLLAFTITAVGVYSFRNGLITIESQSYWTRKIKITLWLMTAIAWGTVITGTYIIFPPYRAIPPAGTTDLSQFPRYLLLANPSLQQWQNIGMEWKEIVGWVTPIATTVVAYVFQIYGISLLENSKLRTALMELFIAAFAAAGIAGVFGAFITKIAPLH